MKAMLRTLAVLSLLLAAVPSTPCFSAASAGRVLVCTGVQDREPVGAQESFPASTTELYCFSEITGAAGMGEVVHVWAKGGVELFRISLPVRAARWRSWSQKKVSPGPWTVIVQTPDGEVLGQVTFKVGD